MPRPAAALPRPATRRPGGLRWPRAAAALVAGLWVLWPPNSALACASCGSGTGDPLILYPHETAKVYLGVGRSQGRQFLTTEGRVGAALGPSAQESLVLSVGLAVTRRGFVTLTVPGLRNVGAGTWATGLGDPSVAARWTMVAQAAARPWLPQAQAIVGFRPGLAASALAGTAHRHDELDRFGEGSDELRLGLDLWWATLPFKAGIASFVLAPLTVPLWGGEWSRAGTTWRLVLTAGADLGRHARLLFTVLRDDQTNRRTNGAVIARSGKTQYSAQSTLEVYLGRWDTLRLSVGRGAIAWSHDATRDVSVGAAWMHAW